jgi:hypothetical protein
MIYFNLVEPFGAPLRIQQQTHAPPMTGRTDNTVTDMKRINADAVYP